ncbi:hypothetical protein [Rathayibacter tritici]|nr:hypothetical protein [Rathayibacter tritici]
MTGSMTGSMTGYEATSSTLKHDFRILREADFSRANLRLPDDEGCNRIRI